ncbi:uncharacterized protein LOC119338660 [Triticum dicoccoides]|uniref:uncharacterized protein LOC119338660 n=1 Tax=Triticum dicoccoides TaxID=85692 RepID=UPI0018916A7C|nr:uncharacterized protein LOC119338660 [Triticum dicoccoides]
MGCDEASGRVFDGPWRCSETVAASGASPRRWKRERKQGGYGRREGAWATRGRGGLWPYPLGEADEVVEVDLTRVAIAPREQREKETSGGLVDWASQLDRRRQRKIKDWNKHHYAYVTRFQLCVEQARSTARAPLREHNSLAFDNYKKKQKHGQGEEEEQPAASFPEDILIDILSRVPYRSLCRFKCVSKEWLALCSDSDIRKRSPQTLSGFFYFDHGWKTLRPGWRFQNLSGKGAPMVDLDDLPFLGSTYKHFSVTQCSTSLLLCRCWKSRPPKDCGWSYRLDLDPWMFIRWPEVAEFDYVVCNPATREWTVLPPIELPGHLSCSHPGKYILGFDPATLSRFVVFAHLNTNYGMSMEMIYSSDTGGWTSMQSQRDDVGVDSVSNFGSRQSTLLNGTLHFPAYESIVTLDMKRNAWRKIKMPPGMINNYVRAFIGPSKGHLYAWHIKNRYDGQLSIWVLENYDSGQWTLKWVVNCFELFGRDRLENGKSYSMFAIHPECNLIFLTDGTEKVLSYNMDNQKVHVICTSVEFSEGLPYTPCFAEWTTDG